MWDYRSKLISLFIICSLLLPSSAIAISCGDQIPTAENELSEYIASCNAKINDAKGTQATLSTAIKYLNNQISLTQAQIQSTEVELQKLEVEITDLVGKISSIDYSLEDLTRLFITRVQATYKSRLTSSFNSFASNSGLTDWIMKLEYLNKVRDNDQKIMLALEKTRLDYDAQKLLKEAKTKEVELAKAKLAAQKTNLARQKTDKDKLLAETKNDESKYQKLLSTAKAELDAIQGIIAGKGTETKVGRVNEGDKVATVIPGESACSTGTHLHFEVAQSGSRKNPFDLLRSTSLIWDNADSEQNGKGDWRWPIFDPIRVTQGFGQTSYSSRYAGNFHTGVDMVNQSNLNVVSVGPGELYRGGMACGGGTLRYVRVRQDNGYDVYYLHVNYF